MSNIENNDYSHILKLGRRGEKIDLDTLKEGITKNEKNKSIFEKFDTDKDGKLDENEIENLKDVLLNLAGEDGILSKREVKRSKLFGNRRADAKNLYAALNDMYLQQLNAPKEQFPVKQTPVEQPLEEQVQSVQDDNPEVIPAPEPREETPAEQENTSYQYKVNYKDTWYGIVQAKYGITDHKQTMEIVRQLKAQNNVDPKAANMPSEITLPDTVALKDGREVKLADLDAEVDQSHWGFKTTSETGRYTVTQNGKTRYYAADGTELKQSYYEAKEASADKRKVSENGSGRYSYTAQNGDTYYFAADGTMLKKDYYERRETEYTALKAQNETLKNAREAFQKQQDEDGWAGKTADAMSVLWNSDNRAVKVEEDLKTYENQMKELQQAQSQGAAQFNTKFKEIFGVDYNPKSVAAYEANPTEENYKKAFGTKNDIHKRVMDYNASQQAGAEIVKGTATVAAGIAIGVATGGTGFVAMGAAAVGTAAASATINTSDRLTSNVGLKEGELGDIAKNAAIDGASVIAGGVIGKAATTAVKGVNTASTIARASINAAGDVAVGAGTEYMQTGEVTVEGTLINTAMAGVGFAAESGAVKGVVNKLRGKSGSANISKTPELEAGNLQTPKTEIANSRDVIADGEVARNINQQHLDANQRKMIDEALEDVPTPQDLKNYSKEIEYKAPTPEEQAALDIHQAQVNKDYADMHKIENNAVIKEQKKSPLQKDDIQKLNDEIKSLDGSIRRLEQQIAGAKRFGKDTSKLEAQLFDMQAKRAAKVENVDNLVNQAALENNVKAEVKGKTTESNTLETNSAESVNSTKSVSQSRPELDKYVYNPNRKLTISRKSKGDAKFFNNDLGTQTTPEHIEFIRQRQDLFNGTTNYGCWAGYNPQDMHHGAWKMHLYSIDEQDWQNMSEAIIPYLRDHDIEWKTLNSMYDVTYLNGDIQQGKAFTIYPRDNAHMEQVAKDLDYIIRKNKLQTENSDIVGDRQMGDSGRLFYRYEYNTGKVKDEVLDLSNPEDKARYNNLYDSNSRRYDKYGEGRYLADDMTTDDDPWLNFDPSDPNSKPASSNNTDIETSRQLTSEDRMAMAQIGNNIGRARTTADLNKAQVWLDRIPDCDNKTRLQQQLNEKYQKLNAVSGEHSKTVSTVSDNSIDNSKRPQYKAGVDYNQASSFTQYSNNELKNMFEAEPLSVERFRQLANYTYYDDLRLSGKYTMEESITGNFDDFLDYNPNVKGINVFYNPTNGWIWHSLDNGCKRIGKDRISLAVKADPKMLAEIDELMLTGSYKDTAGNIHQLKGKEFTKGYYKTDTDEESWLKRHDPLTFYFDETVSEEMIDALAIVTDKYKRIPQRELPGAVEGCPWIAHEAYITGADIDVLIKEAGTIDINLANAIKAEGRNISTGQYNSYKQLINDYKRYLAL